MFNNMCATRSRYIAGGIFLLVFGALVYVGGAPRVAFAGTLSVSPRIIDLPLSPRDIKSETIHILNTSGSTLTVFTFVQNVTVGVDGGAQEFVTPALSDRTTSLSSWIETPRAGTEVAAGATHEASLTIRVDPRVEPGTYHALVSYATGQTIDDASKVVAGGGAPSVLITVRIEAPSNDFMKLAHFVVKKFIVDTGLKETISYDVTNAGDTELKPYGDILIYNGNGEEVASIPVNPEARSIQPSETASFKTQIPEGSFFGKYKALLTVRYGAEQAALYDTVYFYVFPWKKVLLIFGTLLVLIVGCVLWIHHRVTARREGDESDDEDGVANLPLFVKEDRSATHHRDVIIKKT